MNVPLPAAPRAPEIVLRQWREATDRQFAGVVTKARRVEAQAHRLLDRHQRRRVTHERVKPQAPTGLFAAVGRSAYETAAKAWEATRAAIERRIARVGEHLDRLAGYMRRAFPHEARGSPGERLAEKKAAVASPELAAEARAAIERQHQQKEQNVMAKEATLYTKSDRDVQAEKDRLERDGKLAQRQNDTLDQEKAEATASAKPQEKDGQKPETDKERRVREAREAIRRQRGAEREDRDQNRGRGR